MLHTMQVRVVTRKARFTLHHEDPVVHKVFYFCPSMLTAQGIKDIDAHIAKVIEADIEKFKQQFPEFMDVTFTTVPEKHTPVMYIG